MFTTSLLKILFMNRRDFIYEAGIGSLGALSIQGLPSIHSNRTKEIKIAAIASAVEKEPLIRPFGFKGGFLTEIWQSVVQLKSQRGSSGIGLGTQSVLWSDPRIFAANSEQQGNELMYKVTQHALHLLNGRSFTDPLAVLDKIFDEVLQYGRKITGRSDLRSTFVLNALVPVDNALWMLYAKENGISTFDSMIPAPYRKTLSQKLDKLAYIPLVSYNLPMSELKQICEDGSFFIKIKLGHPGTQEEMLEKDKEHLTLIHQTIGSFETPYTQSGKLLYYFDANGRYESKELLQRYLDHARKTGAFDQIAIIEEPFPEEYEADVSDLGIRISADECAHTDKDVLARIQMGYRAIALKPVAKTLSMTLKMAKTAYEHNIPCFCADLTVNPILVEWNKNVAARLQTLPGLKTGLLETNGALNYKYWDKMCSYSPANGASWTKVQAGLFSLDSDYYKRSGGLFENSSHYQKLVTLKD